MMQCRECFYIPANREETSHISNVPKTDRWFSSCRSNSFWMSACALCQIFF